MNNRIYNHELLSDVYATAKTAMTTAISTRRDHRYIDIETVVKTAREGAEKGAKVLFDEARRARGG